jgi:hypothetical protein
LYTGCSETKNHAQVTSDISDDINCNLTILSSDDKIPSDKIPQNHAQIGNSGDTDDILHTSQDFLYSCYHCDDFHTNSERDYERHVMLNHQKGTADVSHPCYPTRADIERLGLKAQGKDWEI